MQWHPLLTTAILHFDISSYIINCYFCISRLFSLLSFLFRWLSYSYQLNIYRQLSRVKMTDLLLLIFTSFPVSGSNDNLCCCLSKLWLYGCLVASLVNLAFFSPVKYLDKECWLFEHLFSARLFTECCGRPLHTQITIKHVSVMTRKPTIRWVCFQTVITSNILTNSSLRLCELHVKKYYQYEANDKPLVKMINFV